MIVILFRSTATGGDLQATGLTQSFGHTRLASLSVVEGDHVVPRRRALGEVDPDVGVSPLAHPEGTPKGTSQAEGRHAANRGKPLDTHVIIRPSGPYRRRVSVHPQSPAVVLAAEFDVGARQLVAQLSLNEPKQLVG